MTFVVSGRRFSPRHAACCNFVHAAGGMPDPSRARRPAPERGAIMATRKQQPADRGAVKDPAEWTTGEEPMTGAQESYVHTLAREAGEGVGDDLTKAEASQKIEDLQEKTGRGAAKAKGKAPAKRRARRTP